MLFNSLAYAVFLPIVFALYWILPHRHRWILLLVSSCYFYMSWKPGYIVLIAFTTLVSFFCGIRIREAETAQAKKLYLILALTSCLGVLFFFKYFNFLSRTVVDLIGFFTIAPHPVTVKLLLPVGISFYTFQTLSYVIDVYRDRIEPERHLGIYAAFISFFPQLVAGPIERAGNLLPQIREEKHFDYDTAIYGARQILWGLFKKIAVADVLSYYVDTAYGSLDACSGADCLIAVFFFTVQIYCDFSGYSDIAIGSARLFGIRLMTNFSSPYFSLSVREFWTRWHISLSTWFKDYVYIPLGGNRCSRRKNYRNIMLTFLASGLWHGADWTFVIWGGMHGLAQILEKAFHADRFRQSRGGRLLSWFLVFVFCNFAWVFFRADSFRDAFLMISRIFSGLPDLSYYLHSSLGFDRKACLTAFLLSLLVGVFDAFSLKTDVIAALGKMERGKRIVRILAEYALLALIVYSLQHGVDTNQFVYFQF